MTSDTTTTSRPWLNAELPVDERVELLLAEMTVPEKAGLFFHSVITIGEDGHLADADPVFGLPSNRALILERGISHVNLLGGAPTASTIARWHNRLQELAATTRLGIPITLSTDPRHGFIDNPALAAQAGPFSQWPEPLGLAATRDPELVEQFADIARREYLAVGFRVALHPQVDLTTEPRWARQLQTFGEDADLTSTLAEAYVRGFQGAVFGADSVSTMTKHFPGGGPQKDGEDPHFVYGREQVYPGGMFEHHLKPFEAVLAAGGRQMMPYYGMPVDTEYEEVGFGFNKGIITGLLRERYGFDGIVCTDWGLLSDSVVFGTHFPARAWGVEHLTPQQRIIKILDAGADQFGGESDVHLLTALVETGQVSETRLDQSARRLLREKFLLGLFENPYVDAATADRVVGSPEFRAAGAAAQRAAITVLKDTSILPLPAGSKIYVEGIAADAAAAYGTVVATPDLADVAILRLQAPFDVRDSVFENFFHAGALDYPAEVIDHVQHIAATVPTIIDVFLDRPAILAPLAEAAAVLTVNWGASAEALLDVLSGHTPTRGQLPFDIPRSTHAVETSLSDVPFDTTDPLFKYGEGLRRA